ncbi:phage baseplate assembly protein V [Clostridium aceticum]|uniref:Phage baseplate assembly protein V n=1 Tax=Clostridium aceticum TaxID=84022 RepID=A0A0G3W8Q4_9CLOT|nr:phage baseplate assembly protein V [Clostridium aceticum]AKL95021.1 phage baseplate assembly protein V [Clostridium aceticum]
MFDDIDSKKVISILMNIIRVGTVHSVDEVKGTVKVSFQDKDKIVSNDLPILDREYDLPKVGQQALCLFLPNGIQEGFCLRSFYSNVNPPPVQDKNLYHKAFGDGTCIEYDKINKELTIKAAGDLKIISSGDILIEADGNLTTKAGNFNSAISQVKTVPIIHHP